MDGVKSVKGKAGLKKASAYIPWHLIWIKFLNLETPLYYVYCETTKFIPVFGHYIWSYDIFETIGLSFNIKRKLKRLFSFWNWSGLVEF